jgi:hypothetical protein
MRPTEGQRRAATCDMAEQPSRKGTMTPSLWSLEWGACRCIFLKASARPAPRRPPSVASSQVSPSLPPQLHTRCTRSSNSGRDKQELQEDACVQREETRQLGVLRLDLGQRLHLLCTKRHPSVCAASPPAITRGNHELGGEQRRAGEAVSGQQPPSVRRLQACMLTARFDQAYTHTR